MKSSKNRSRKSFVGSYITSFLSISLVLFLMGMLGLVVLNAKRLADYVRENIGLTIILDDDIREAEVVQFQKTIKAADFTKSTRYIDKEQAAKELSEDLGEDFVGFLGYNPLQEVIDVKLHAGYSNPDSMLVLEKYFSGNPLVKEVHYQKDLVSIINRNLNRIGGFLLIFSGVLLLIFFVLINNTIRMGVYAQRFVINTMMLVGATRAFIRRPFIFRSVVIGVLGSSVASVLLLGLIYGFHDQLEAFINFHDMNMLGFLIVLVFLLGIFISWFSTRFAVDRYLRMKFDDLF
ncbi:FtsX-like permease family protein [Puteibacter caeruleilacunae]|nr:FtsX-like permease family protein [Puteibacter caeruleilacunae]